MNEVQKIIVQQIGVGNLLAISGGRVRPYLDCGVILPVSHGYTVEVVLMPNDTYTVRRVFTRSGKRFLKGTSEFVYCTEVGEIAYQASCFRNVEFGD